MMYRLAICFSYFCAAVLWYAESSTTPIAVFDFFKLNNGKLEKQHSDGILNATWYSQVSDLQLDVLSNDVMSGDTLETCIIHEHKKPTESSNELTFKEIAKILGFKHTHRDSIAARPHCVFDFVIPFYNSTNRAKLPGEFCTTEHITGGAAVGDYDNDGKEDIYFSVFNKRSVLYKNLGNGEFRDVTIETDIGPDKYANGAVWVDIDQDGDLDLYVTTVGGSHHHLYVNYAGRFRDEAKKRSISMEFANKRKLAGFTPNVGDFDNDGYPDIYVSEWILHSQDGLPSASRLMRNLGAKKPGYFEDVTDKVGVNMDHHWTSRTILNAGTHTFGSSFTDFDNDGHQELLITGDYGESKMFWNNGNMSFTECTRACGLTGDVDAMGHAIGDWNNDGYLEWFSTAIFDNATNCEVTGCMFGNKGNKLFKNLGNKKFTDVSDYAGVRNGGWGWGAAFFDFNNDGYLDIVMTNGIDTPSTTVDDVYMKQQMMLFENISPSANAANAGKMKEVASKYGMMFHGMGRGLLKFDYDNDGDEDVVIASNVGPPIFYKNIGGNKNNWLRLRVVHRCKNDMTKLCDSYGARVTVTDPEGRKQMQEVGSSTHFLGQSEFICHFGLLNYKDNITVQVSWPATNQKLKIYNVTANNVLRITRPLFSGNSPKEIESNFSSIKKCRRLEITNVKLQPGALYGVEISPDKQSLKLKLHPAVPLHGLGLQSFKYSAKVIPSDKPIEATATVHIDARLNIRNKTLTSMCPSGRLWLPGMPVPKKYDQRLINGFSNNQQNLYWGAATGNLRRLASSKYADDISMPAGACSKQQRLAKTCPYPNELSGYGSVRPPPRVISNELFAQTESVISQRGLSDLFVHYGQFFVHDLDFSSPLPRFEFQGSLNEVWMQISVPKGDPHFDQDGTGDKYLPFIRSTYNRCTGSYPNGYSREQINKISSYIDATDVYGSSVSRCNKLRTMVDGKMRLDEDGIIPKNDVGLDNDNPTGRKPSVLRVAGDTRANVAPGLLVLHTLFVKEHNRLCDEYKKRHSSASDEEIFKYAKRIVIAEHQAIAFREYLPALVGSKHIPPYTGYDATVDASVSNVFATAAFRFGHSQVNSHIFRFDESWNISKYGHILLRESYFHPERIPVEGGIDPIIRGMIRMPAQEIDILLVDELRNVLFPVGRGNGLDLAAMNIQRGRDHGLPDFNSVRKELGLKSFTHFSQITKNKKVASKLKKLYKDINNIDLWVGGLAEDHLPGSELGETFHKIFLEGILKIRNGDRFWYEKIMSKQEIEMVNNLTLGKIIKLNSGVKDAPGNVFFSTKQCTSVVNHECRKRKTDNTNNKEHLLSKIDHLLKSQNKVKMEYQESIQNERDKKSRFRTAAIILPFATIMLLCLVYVLVNLQRRYCTRRNMKEEQCKNLSNMNDNVLMNQHVSNGNGFVPNGNGFVPNGKQVGIESKVL